MYRLTLYVLGALIGVAMLLGALGILAMSPLMLLFSLAYITAICILTNALFAKMFDAPTNVESLYITALILVLLISPPNAFLDGAFLELAGWASVWAMASKYLFAVRRKHLFNPAAFGVAIPALFLDAAASWWIATPAMMPVVLILGLILTRKMQRFDLFLSFLLVALLTILIPHWSTATFLPTVWRALADAPVLFFGFIMLTEPLTTPPTKGRRILYSALTGIFFAPWMHIGSLFFTPELALLAGNIVAYILSPKAKVLMTLREKREVAKETYDFWFTTDRTIRFTPGQYLEWTLPHMKSDKRGNRRYFTISSAPEEEGIAIGVKFNEQGSSFKKKMLSLQAGDTMAAGQLAGDFTMPKNPKVKLAFIAGGIGVTPFRSMIRSLYGQKIPRSIVLFYANRRPQDIAYRDVFDAAERDLCVKTIYTLTDRSAVPDDWNGSTGHITEDMIRTELPDFPERHFYLSGPQSMVHTCDQLLRHMGVPKRHIKKDFFPGF